VSAQRNYTKRYCWLTFIHSYASSDSQKLNLSLDGQRLNFTQNYYQETAKLETIHTAPTEVQAEKLEAVSLIEAATIWGLQSEPRSAKCAHPSSQSPHSPAHTG